MRKGQTKGDKKLQHSIRTRITDKRYQEIKALVDKTKDESIAGAVRKIIMNRPIRIFVHDETHSLLLEELAATRSELKAIGVNINQMTRYFNTYPEDDRKRFYAKIGLTQFIQMETKMNWLTTRISELCEVWLSVSKQGKEYKGP